ncbi:MAG: HD family phosphohydrolase [Anaerotignaceae bacterium]
MRKTVSKKPENNKRRTMNMAMLAVAFVVTAVAIVTGSYVKDNEVVTVGSVASRRYIATRNIENTFETQKLKEEAAESVGELYKLDATVQQTAIEQTEEFFNDLNNALSTMENNAQLAYDEAVKQAEVSALNGTKTVLPSEEDLLNFDLKLVTQIPVAVSAQQAQLYYQLTADGKEQFKADVINAINFAYEQKITNETMEKITQQTFGIIDEALWQEQLIEFGKAVAEAVLKPNLVLDEEAIGAAKEQLTNDVEPVMVLKNQKIVDEGEIVTEEAYQLLSELGLINKSYAGSIIPFVGSISIVFLGFIVVYFYMITQQKKVLEDEKKTVVLFALYILTVIMHSALADLSTFYFIPVSIFAMLLSILIKPKIALILNVFVSVSALFIFNGSTDFLLYALITGSFAALLVQYTNRRARILVVSALVGTTHMATYMAVRLFFDKAYTVMLLQDSIYAAFVGIASVVIVVGSLPLWEAMFGINTQYRLMELANPNNDTMRRLMIETPGTYHHCLIVANLAETAAYDIFANGALARVGAYYHDIGKLENPLYFSENQFGENVHDHLDPYISARMIISHVENGVKMAEENRVPKIVRDIIEQHHGTTLVKYFYMKSTKEKATIETLESDFRYKGPIPQSKEAAIVMLADTVEAAIRSSLGEGKSIAEVEELIDKLFKDKLNDGQLNDCRLDLKEIEAIKKAFIRVFNGMYHDRIAYPKDEEIEAARQQQEKKQEQKKQEE